MTLTYTDQTRARLDKFVSDSIPEITRSQIKKIILAGQVTVNGKIVSVHHWLKSGDKIVYADKKTKASTKKIVIKPKPKIVFQSDEYLIINKPNGLLVHATDRGETNTLAEWLVQNFPVTKKIGDDPLRPAIVHRLDKEVSGLMVIPLSEDSFTNIKRQFQDRTIKKEYTALVHGRLLNDHGSIEAPIERDKKTGLMKVQIAKRSGKIAITTYELMKKYLNYSLVKVQIKTGRTHQIRAHFYSIGHSIVGDKLYQTKDIRKKKKVLAQRIFLHAHYLEFTTLDGTRVHYDSNLPLELKKFLTTLK